MPVRPPALAAMAIDDVAQGSGHDILDAGAQAAATVKSRSWSLSYSAGHSVDQSQTIKTRVATCPASESMSAKCHKRTSLRLRQASLHEIESVAVQDCRVSEGISQPPRL